MIRSLGIAAILLGSTGLGHAADLAALPLRGTIVDPVARPSWDGFYLAGHGGYSTFNMDLKKVGTLGPSYTLNNFNSTEQASLSNWGAIKNHDARHATFGGIAGYNIQMDDSIIGVEVDYTHTNLMTQETDIKSQTVTFANGNRYDLTVGSSAAAKLTDYATARARLGYLFGDLMPFATFGAAVGRFQTATSTGVLGVLSNAASTPPIPSTLYGPALAQDGKKDNYRFGYTAGLGVEYMFAAGFFGRLEYQYVAFNIGKTDLHVARAAIGVKF